MLSGLTSYLFGGSTEEGHPAVTTKSAVNLATEAAMKNSPKLRTSSTDEGWEIVDKSSRSHSPAATTERTTAPDSPLTTSPMTTSTHSSTSSRGSSQYHVHAHTPSDSSEDEGEGREQGEAAARTSSSSSSPVRCRHPSLHESWLVTPPPCFTLGGNSPHRLEEDPMENLLIEHPSMSVYQHRGGRPNSRGSSDEDEEAVVMDTSSPRQVADTRHGSRSARLSPSSSSLQAALAAKSKHGAQAAKKRKDAKQMARKQLDRTNKLTQYNSSCKSARRKHHLTRCNAGRTNDRKCQY